jgi:acetyl-CoA hydrolase
VIATEQGIADLRGKDPYQRAELIVRNCAHPDFRDELFKYLDAVLEGGGHAPFALGGAFAMHQHYLATGDMRGVDWSKI